MTAPGNPFEHLHIRLEYKRRMTVIKAVLQKPTSFYCHLRERERERGREGEIIQATATVTNVEHAN